MYKECCPVLKDITRHFLDISSKDDSDLRLLGPALRACDYELFDQESLQTAGNKILEYLDRKIVKDHFFWARSLTSYSASDQQLKIDLFTVEKLVKDL